MKHFIYGLGFMMIVGLTACEGGSLPGPQAEQAAQPPPTQQPTVTVGVTVPLPTATTVNQTTSGVVTTPTTIPIATLAVTATSIITQTAQQTLPSGGTVYAAEKISLAPANINFDVATLSAQSAFLTQSTEPPLINFAGWSNSGQMFAFAIPLPSVLTDPTALEGSNTYTTAELWIANLDGMGLQKITDQVGSLVLWSPDDNKIAYFKQIGVSKQELWVIDLNTNTHLKLDEPTGIDINETDYYSHIDWFDNDNLLYTTYSSRDVNPIIQRHLWLHNIQTGQIEEVQIDDKVIDAWIDVWLALDKTSIAGRTTNDVWLGQLVKENGKIKLEYIKTLVSGNSLVPYWGPNSTKLAVKSIGNFPEIVHLIDLHIDDIVEVTFPYNVATIDWSPDSRTLIVSNFGAGTGLPNTIYVVNTDGSNLRKLGEFFFGSITWAPDGQHLSLIGSHNPNLDNSLGILKVEVNK